MLNPTSLLLPFRRALLVPAVVLLGGCAGLLNAPQANEPAKMDAAAYAALGSLDYPGNQGALERLDREIASAGADPARVSAIVENLVGVLGRPQATFAARQAVAQRLGQLLSAQTADAAALAALAPMLEDARLVNVGRLALEPVRSPAVDAAFMGALQRTGGATRLALIQSVGNRRIDAAVPALSTLLADADAPTADAAARALGSIGTSGALSALDAAPDPSAVAVVAARLSCIAADTGTGAAEALRSILNDARVSRTQRAAAWRGILDREPSAAPKRIVVALDGDDPVLRQVALEAIASLKSRDLVPTLCENLVTFDGATQAAVIEALSRKGDAAAVPAVLASARSPDPRVRSAAITALGSLPGDRETAMELAHLATRTGAEAKLARHSLARLDGPEVDAVVLAGAAKSEPGLRALFLEEIGMRDMTEGDPLLLAARADPDAAVRAAALQSLVEIAPAADQGAVLSWAVEATDATEVARALKALVSITKRNPDAAARDRAVVAAIDGGASQVRLRLLPVLPRLGDAPAAACAGRMALDSSPEVAAAATSILVNWPEGAALPELVGAAERSAVADVRDAALHGAMRVVDRRRAKPAAEPTDLVARLLAVAKDRADRSQLVFLLGRGSSDSALSLARSLKADPALAGEAREAALAIRANRQWPPGLKASANADMLGYLVDGDKETAWWAHASAGAWIQEDFGRSRPVRRVTLDQTGRTGDFPERYEVFVTDDPDAPGKARAAGAGESEKTVIELPAGTQGRYLIIRDVAASGEGTWSVTELQVD